mmetsp:Transcript_39385/g.35081  ORF Transcript_39385/g.35081 Transcript_39385/m.35081 type:complete len:99 (+) Transcript_39385:1532-1828(+)
MQNSGDGGANPALNPNQVNININDPTKDPANPRHRHQPLNISFLEWMVSFVPLCKRIRNRSKLLIKGKERIDGLLDVFELLEKIKDVDKLKACLFDDN